MNIGLLIGLLITHWLADFTHLLEPCMLEAKRAGKPILPIIAHASVHAILAAIVCFYYVSDLVVFISLIYWQLITHALIDIWKGRMQNRFAAFQNPLNPYHWYLFGFDQLLHVLVIISMWYYSFNPIP